MAYSAPGCAAIHGKEKQHRGRHKIKPTSDKTREGGAAARRVPAALRTLCRYHPPDLKHKGPVNP